MPKGQKHKKKHVVKLYRGRPVKPKIQRRATPGRPPIYPPDEQTMTLVRSRQDERRAWDAEAARRSAQLGLPPGRELTSGPWLRMIANQAAGFVPPVKK